MIELRLLLSFTSLSAYLLLLLPLHHTGWRDGSLFLEGFILAEREGWRGGGGKGESCPSHWIRDSIGSVCCCLLLVVVTLLHIHVKGRRKEVLAAFE